MSGLAPYLGTLILICGIAAASHDPATRKGLDYLELFCTNGTRLRYVISQ